MTPTQIQAISIHAPREGGDPVDDDLHLLDGISIHAPREGGDQVTFQEIQDSGDISIHAPREGGDGGCWEYAAWWWLFQSTPPARGATKVSRLFDKLR